MTKSATTTPISSSSSSSLLLSSSRCGQHQQQQQQQQPHQHQIVPKLWTRPESIPPRQQQQQPPPHRPPPVTAAHDEHSVPSHHPTSTTTTTTTLRTLVPPGEGTTRRTRSNQGGGGAVLSSTTPAIADHSKPDRSTLATRPIAIGRPPSPGRTRNSFQSGGTQRTQKHRRETPRGQQASRATKQNCWNDPLEVALSTTVQDYLTSIDITTAAQLLLAPTTAVAQHFPAWRRTKGMAPLQSDTGHLASVSVWKRKVRVQAARVGAHTLARVNEGTNLKPVVVLRDDDERHEPETPLPLPVITDQHLFKRVAKTLSVPPAANKRRKTEDGGGTTDPSPYVTPYTDAMKFGIVHTVHPDGQNIYVVKWDDGEEEEVPIEDVVECIEEYHTNIHRDPRGWRKEVIVRTNAATAHTTHDRYFLTPDQRYKLRSVVEVQKFQAALLATGGDEQKAKKLFRNIKIVV